MRSKARAATILAAASQATGARLRSWAEGHLVSNVLRNLPSVGELLESPPLKSLVGQASRNSVVAGVRRFLDNMTSQVQSAATGLHVPSATELAQQIADWIVREDRSGVEPVINGTGVILS